MQIIRRANVDDSHLNTLVCDPVLRQILARRGVKSQDDLEVGLKNIFPPDRLTDIDKASTIIARAIMDKKRIMIAGDYDIDGMTGTALGVRCLKAFGVNENLITYYVPSRYADGYGLNTRIVERAIHSRIDLIVTVDNGITAFDAVALARRHGISVVITDHHEVQATLPDADAVVDPKRRDDTFPSKHLCGAGVLFYVMSAVRSRLIEMGYYASLKDSPSMGQFLDLVTLGTIGDVMSFDTNNRRIIKAGMKRISKGKSIPGIQALLSYLKVDPAKIRVKNISHELCPRFNAATRINIAQNPAILNLTNDDFNLAMLFARQLDLCNKRRMDHEKIMISRALALYKEERLRAQELRAAMSADSSKSADAGTGTDGLSAAATAGADGNAGVPGMAGAPDMAMLRSAAAEADRINTNDRLIYSDADDIADAYNSFDQAVSLSMAQDDGIVLYDDSFLKGLCGLVANRIKERYNKPCIIFSSDNAAFDDSNINLMGIIDNNGSSVPPALQMPAADAAAAAAGATSTTCAAAAAAGTAGITGASAATGDDGLDSDEDVLEPGLKSKVFGAQEEVPENVGMRVRNSAKLVSAASGIMPSMTSDLFDDTEHYEDEGDIPLVGSARSVKGTDLMKVFALIKEQDPDIFLTCGGHAVAAGASIRTRDLERFKVLFSAACAQCRGDAQQEESVVSECLLPDAYLCLDFARDLEYFGPWGKDFEEPVFDGEFLVDSVNILRNRHLKVILRSPGNRVVEGIKFRANAKEKAITEGSRVRAVYTLGIDRYMDRERLQLYIDAIEPF